MMARMIYLLTKLIPPPHFEFKYCQFHAKIVASHWLVEHLCFNHIKITGLPNLLDKRRLAFLFSKHVTNAIKFNKIKHPN